MAIGKQPVSPSLRLALVSGGNRTTNAMGYNSGPQAAVLVSYAYLKPFLKIRKDLDIRDWVMDSGAFTIANTGGKVDLQQFIETCKFHFETDDKLTEVFALDDMFSWRQGIKNTEQMWRQGVQAIPTFHPGEPWDVLKAIARDYPKIAIGGVVGLHQKAKIEWVGQCFARVWPKKIHGLGMAGREVVMRFPFHSVDASSWEQAPCKFGQYRAYGNECLRIRGSNQPLRPEVDYFLRVENDMRTRWAKEMALLESLDPS